MSAVGHSFDETAERAGTAPVFIPLSAAAAGDHVRSCLTTFYVRCCVCRSAAREKHNATEQRRAKRVRDGFANLARVLEVRPRPTMDGLWWRRWNRNGTPWAVLHTCD